MKALNVVFVVCGFGLILGFQNCARTTFSSTEHTTNSDKSSLVAIDGDQPAQTTEPSENHPGKSDQQADGSEEAGDDDYVACVLVDHGKSLKLGLISGSLDGSNSVANSVCVTKRECLGEVAKAFKVEGAYDRGYCDHNPNVRRLSDKDCHDLLAAH